FRTRTVQTKDGSLIKGFSPAISKKSMMKIVKECFRLKFHRWTQLWYARKWMRETAADFSYIFPHWQHGFTH
ncbi:MAG: hypothetical protein V3V14_04235, partial [Saprospiraceae bacterium]